MYRNIVLSLLLIFLSPWAYGQSYYPNFYQYTTVDGLPSSQIYQIIQTKNNHIWFGTDGGVVHYDGYNFEVLTINDGLASNVVFYLDEAPDGSIWFYHSGHLLSFYKSGKIYPFKYNYLLQNTSRGDFQRTYSLTVDHDEATIYGGVGRALSKRYLTISEKNGITYSPDSTSEKNCVEIWNPKDKQPQISSFICNDDSTTIYINKKAIGIITGYYDKPRITRCAKFEDRIYFNIYHDIFVYEGGEISKLGTTQGDILEICSRGNGDILLGTSNGLWVLPKGNMEVQYQWLKGKLISSICEDNERGLWIGSLLSGLYYLPPNYSS
ncbi:MAG: hypothetical protein MI810_10310, partial [Flavobacteriales bacterium]|nr:hypothetical protein [Flavobacteriales bacterium]